MDAATYGLRRATFLIATGRLYNHADVAALQLAFARWRSQDTVVQYDFSHYVANAIAFHRQYGSILTYVEVHKTGLRNYPDVRYLKTLINRIDVKVTTERLDISPSDAFRDPDEPPNEFY